MNIVAVRGLIQGRPVNQKFRVAQKSDAEKWQSEFNSLVDDFFLQAEISESVNDEKIFAPQKLPNAQKFIDDMII